MVLLSFLFFLNAWLVAITNVIANGSNTKIKSKIKRFATCLISQPEISLIYLIEPNSLPSTQQIPY